MRPAAVTRPLGGTRKLELPPSMAGYQGSPEAAQVGERAMPPGLRGDGVEFDAEVFDSLMRFVADPVSTKGHFGVKEVSDVRLERVFKDLRAKAGGAVKSLKEMWEDFAKVTAARRAAALDAAIWTMFMHAIEKAEKAFRAAIWSLFMGGVRKADERMEHQQLEAMARRAQVDLPETAKRTRHRNPLDVHEEGFLRMPGSIGVRLSSAPAANVAARLVSMPAVRPAASGKG